MGFKFNFARHQILEWTPDPVCYATPRRGRDSQDSPTWLFWGRLCCVVSGKVWQFHGKEVRISLLFTCKILIPRPDPVRVLAGIVASGIWFGRRWCRLKSGCLPGSWLLICWLFNNLEAGVLKRNHLPVLFVGWKRKMDSMQSFAASKPKPSEMLSAFTGTCQRSKTTWILDVTGFWYYLPIPRWMLEGIYSYSGGVCGFCIMTQFSEKESNQ